MPSSKTPRRRILIIQSYVPAYRTRFFNLLHSRLDAEGIALEVLHGSPPPDQAARRDADICLCSKQVPTRRLSLPGGRSLSWCRVQDRATAADVVVLGQALQNIEAYPLLLRQHIGRFAGHAPPVALWGHGRTYTKPVSRLEAWAKDVLTLKASWFFAYTEGGAAHAAGRGFPRDRITVVRNSVDTTELADARDRADVPGTPQHTEATLLRERYNLVPGLTALFLGGLDSPKRISFLLKSVRRIAAELPGFRLLVAGEGTDRGLVDDAASRPGSAVVALGRVIGERRALLGAVSDVMLMPGRVGLCAVDSFALRTPVVTTNWPWHAPEFDYLESDRNAVVTPDDPVLYAAAVTALLRDAPRLQKLRAACAADAADYTVEDMAARFCDGLLRMLGERKDRVTV
ncbi:glycosyltransferase family 4 protein [Streptomyces sp. NPDC003758]|uniref:D-inositol 3-phosphate glycosyltransferase n=1 Tax=Streptomyces cynarae TaxID=2981134 RepID=A0ABY6E2U9_9ACTN|nr:glycosyltransferase family 4 protein [Streptomyces cynarae]UXY21001.1 glycosyltransferase family 4 protein [Streptomyces cynarae]